jgi:transcriptional regulator with XRE-family HTH domain
MPGRKIVQSKLSIFVGKRLKELEMSQSEFCHVAGFDQGLLSKIQSSMVTTMTIETALRLALGLEVQAEEIFRILGRPDLHELILKAYPAGEKSAEVDV